MRDMATLPQGNPELLVVRDKVGRTGKWPLKWREIEKSQRFAQRNKNKRTNNNY